MGRPQRTPCRTGGRLDVARPPDESAPPFQTTGGAVRHSHVLGSMGSVWGYGTVVPTVRQLDAFSS